MSRFEALLFSAQVQKDFDVYKANLWYFIQPVYTSSTFSSADAHPIHAKSHIMSLLIILAHIEDIDATLAFKTVPSTQR